MKKRTSDFMEDIIRLRNEGATYDEIVLWLAKNKQFLISPSSIRGALKRQEAINILNK
ncbi:hypothetical protein [Candidatus Arsenophonus triatominarum]|uniref:hypothetical protein n=1 Tax=Candidatus Arsenophonus triatominarum TaxID=57911 RepID=UPI000A813D19|nr:hypothetical protein [Candidatus Arsenophonus triatominarum]